MPTALEGARNLLRDIDKHITARHDIERGDKEAWCQWYDKLEALGTFASVVAERLEEEPDAPQSPHGEATDRPVADSGRPA